MKVGITLAIAAAALITPVASAQSAFVSKHGIPKHVTKLCFHDLVPPELGFTEVPSPGKLPSAADKIVDKKFKKAYKKLEKDKKKFVEETHCINWVYEPHRKHVFTLEPTRGGGTVLSHWSLPCEKDGRCPGMVAEPHSNIRLIK